MPPRPRAAILTVDDDPSVSRAVARDLRRRDDVVGRIFESFFTTEPVGEGTGLGLDISWRIVVKKHHGDLAVESRPGETRARVLLPLRDGASADTVPPPA